MPKLRKLLLPLFACFIALAAGAQVTTSSISGIVKGKNGESLVGATIKLTNESTGSVYTSITRKGGVYEIANLQPGGPYLLEVTTVGYQKQTKSGIFLNLGETSRQDFELGDKIENLSEVVVTGSRRNPQGAKGGTETNIGRDKMANLPTVGRRIEDLIRFVPQVKTLGGNDGGISIAGQNNRYNSFFVDGAIQNDVFGLASNGTNGGQAGVSPISFDAIDQFNVVISPYDASLGNFTGGGINAITRSGTNKYEGSVYYFFRDQNLTGKTPGVDKSLATRLTGLSNKTYGFRIGGPIVKNKLFFFLNAELVRDERPQPFNFSTYSGSLTQNDVNALIDTVRRKYGYDMGGYLDNPEITEADRIVSRIDWNLNNKNKLSISYRYNKGERTNTSRSSRNTLNFFNNGQFFPSTSHSGSLELNSRLRNNASNRLLITYTNVLDDRGPIGEAFPRVRIRDGSSSLFFGTEEFSTGNQLKQSNLSLFNVFKFYLGKHNLSVGTDNELNDSYNIFIRQNYGSYDFANISAFYNGVATTYDRSYSLLDPGVTGDKSVNAAAKFQTLRVGFFLNDEVKVSNNLTLNFGIRADDNIFLTTPKTDPFFNDSAIARIAPFYDLEGARSGQRSNIKLAISPRFGFVYKIPDENITIRGGVGLFTGRIPLVWPGGVYNNNGISVGGIRGSNVPFRGDAFNQYTASDLGLTVASPSGQVDLMTKEFRMNKVLRTSLAADKNLGDGWKIIFESIFTKNINEIDYKRVDIVSPLRTAGAGSRNTYPLSGSFTRQIPFRANGTNPYTGVYLLRNNTDKKGYSYNFTFTVDKAWRNGFAFNANYSFGESVVLNEGTSSQNNSQWRFMESVDGRNFTRLSRSDFSLGHRINAYIAKQFKYFNNKLATTVSLTYNGQSGNPFSYTYAVGFIRDLDNSEDNDLIYVPRNASEIVFVQNGTLTPAQQWDLLNSYIENDKYLKNRRGQFAERNGARTPFTHVIDLKLQQDFNVKMGSKTYQLQVSFDVFNFTNFLSSKWGRQYFATNDNFQLLRFNSFVSASDLTPRFTFTPPTNNIPYNISDGVFNSSRWTSQLGFRLNF
jgi:outer membrane receptor for ferrienterochelin and colicin